MRKFKDKVVFISGACGGFGSGAAIRFAAEGARLVITDLDETALKEFSTELALQGATCAYVAADLSQHDGVVHCMEKAFSAYGSIDIAINNAGIAHSRTPLSEIDPKLAQKVIDVDLMGVFYAMQAQIPVMEKRYKDSGTGGVIVNLASVAGIIGAPGLSIYAAAKHGVVGLTKTAAVESARNGIRINALCPSFARTKMVEDEMMDPRLSPEEAEAKLASGIPMRRLAEVEDVVQALVFLCDPENSFMTGQALALDGGLTAI